MHLPTVRLFALIALATLCPGQKKPAEPAAPVGPPGYAEALARYRECINRVPLQHHTEARERLAQTRAAEGLAILVDDYARVRTEPEYSRYMLATLFGRHFDSTDHAQTLTALRLANDKPGDIWLWVQALRIQADRIGDADVVALAQGGKHWLQRAAAIAAIGASRMANLKAVIVPTCVDFPKKDKEHERMALLGAMSGALWDNRSRVNDEDYRQALTAYIGLLGDDVGLSHTAKVQMARHLQWILKGPALFVNPEPWLELMARGDVKKPAAQGTMSQPRFCGVETEGERFCYVVDMSDSMCKPIAPSAKPATGPITGPKQKKKRELLDESDLPWHLINNRWDLAREHLKISLLRMPPDKHFSIVWFGTESGTFASAKGMIKATRANVDRVIADLEQVKVLPPEKDRAPDGVLRGKTNLHSGLRRAYGLAGRGFVDQYGYVDPEALTEGCDTIFLLSDGAPSWDDFMAEDKDYGEGNVVLDVEYNKPMPRQKRIQYPGPFRRDEWLVDDVRRMNAFRRIRMHCIGLGEANMDLLRRLAEMGHGEVFAIGDGKATQVNPGK